MQDQPKGFFSLQVQSRIPAEVWQGYCEKLGLNSKTAVEVWENICQPITKATDTTPDIPFVLKLRATHLEQSIDLFKVEAVQMLHLYALLYNLDDAALSAGKVKGALVAFYASLSHRPGPFLLRLTVEFCTAALLAKVLEKVSFNQALRTLIKRETKVQVVARIGCRGLKEQPYAEAVRACLEHFILAQTVKRTELAAQSSFEMSYSPVEEYTGDEAIIETYLAAFRAAMQKIYLDEAQADEEARQQLKPRLHSLAAFNPMTVALPAAAEDSDRFGEGDKPKPLRRKIRRQAPTSSPSDAFAFSDAGAAQEPDPGQLAKRNVIKEGRRKRFVPEGQEPATEAESPRPTQAPEGLALDPEDLVQQKEIAPGEFGVEVLRFAQLLGELERNDPLVWNILILPPTDLEDLPTVARLLYTEGTGARLAFEALREAALLIGLKWQLQAPPPRGKNRSFKIELTHFVNAVKGTNTPLKANDPKLGSLKTIIDHVVAAFLRLQSIKVNRYLAKKNPHKYTKEAVIGYCEQGLQTVLEEGDQSLLTLVRTKADADTEELLAAFVAERYIEGLLKACSVYVKQIDLQGGKITPEHLTEALALNPFTPEPPEQAGPRLGILPEDKLPLGKWGEQFDTVAAHVCARAWAVLQPIHQPDEVLGALIKLLRQLLIKGMVFEAEKRRPQERPQMALAVANLEKICANPNLQNFYIRLRDDGRPLFVEDYKDNNYIDVYELREYTPVRMRQNASKKAAETDTEQLQTGRKYLFGVGRSKNLWGNTPGELSDSCQKRSDGSIEIFPLTDT